MTEEAASTLIFLVHLFGYLFSYLFLDATLFTYNSVKLCDENPDLKESEFVLQGIWARNICCALASIAAVYLVFTGDFTSSTFNGLLLAVFFFGSLACWQFSTSVSKSMVTEDDWLKCRIKSNFQAAGLTLLIIVMNRYGYFE
ncbi:MAG: hypothetical protein AAGF53_15835 [Pseudomonadota bacterium]